VRWVVFTPWGNELHMGEGRRGRKKNVKYKGKRERKVLERGTLPMCRPPALTSGVPARARDKKIGKNRGGTGPGTTLPMRLINSSAVTGINNGGTKKHNQRI